MTGEPKRGCTKCGGDLPADGMVWINGDRVDKPYCSMACYLAGQHRKGADTAVADLLLAMEERKGLEDEIEEAKSCANKAMEGLKKLEADLVSVNADRDRLNINKQGWLDRIKELEKERKTARSAIGMMKAKIREFIGANNEVKVKELDTIDAENRRVHAVSALAEMLEHAGTKPKEEGQADVSKDKKEAIRPLRGDDKTIETCKAKFDNGTKFGDVPAVPRPKRRKVPYYLCLKCKKGSVFTAPDENPPPGCPQCGGPVHVEGCATIEDRGDACTCGGVEAGQEQLEEKTLETCRHRFDVLIDREQVGEDELRCVTCGDRTHSMRTLAGMAVCANCYHEPVGEMLTPKKATDE